MESETKSCKNCKDSFVIEPDDFSFYKKIGVPPPTFCPTCRLQRRMIFRNERTFYKRSCDLCKKSIISTYPEDAPHPVYCVKCWWSDDWDAYEYGQDFDFSRPFFDQYKELLWRAPALSMMNDDGVSSVNCEYSYDWFYSKNCYLVVCGWHAENVMYTYHFDYGKDGIDCSTVDRSELMYGSVLTFDSYGCKYCALCFDCRDCFLSQDLRGCSDCTLSFGLRSTKYHIFNKPYSKEEYQKKIKELNLGSRESVSKLQAEFEEFKMKFPHKYANILKSVNTTGDVIFSSKNAKNCFYSWGLENSRFVVVNDTGKEIYDCSNTGKPELCYECVTPDEAYGNIGTVYCFRSRDVEYSQYCPSSENCFGCVGLKKGSYSILNKRYSKEEYEKIYPKIIEHMKETGEWGEFFPHWVSPFAYNETAAQEWFPLSEQETESRGYRWREPEVKEYKVTMKPEDLPDTIDEVDDSITKEVVGCMHEGKCNEKCTTAFKITNQEMQFYRRFDIPLPQLCPNCRHYGRIAKRNPPMLWSRKCHCAGADSDNKVYSNTAEHFHGKDHCPNEFETSYAPDRKEIVYCEQCYNAEVA